MVVKRRLYLSLVLAPTIVLFANGCGVGGPSFAGRPEKNSSRTPSYDGDNSLSPERTKNQFRGSFGAASGVELQAYLACWEIAKPELPSNLAQLEYFAFSREQLNSDAISIRISMPRHVREELVRDGILKSVNEFVTEFSFSYDFRTNKVKFIGAFV